MVPTLSIAFMILSLLLGIGIPVALLLFFRKKYQTSIVSFFIGCGVMLLFAQVLEQLVHLIVLGSPVGPFIEKSILAIAIYGALMAGLFEEIGRFIAMRYVLKKQQGNAHNALMYGAGHGGYEMIMILAVGMINNLIYSALINMGQTQAVMAPLDDTMKATVQTAFDALIQTPSWQFLLSPIERMAAITAQIALSVIVWYAATGVEARASFLALAVLLHALLDGVAVYTARSGVPLLAVEAIVWIIALGIVYISRQVWNNNNKKQNADTDLT